MGAAQLASRSLVGLLALAWLSPAQQATQHPTIPLEEGGAGVDFSACVDCHADKSEAPVVHPALEMGCEGCHEVDQQDDATEIFLTVQGNELCLACHGDKEPEPAQLRLHPPLRTGPCLACHDPHSSEADYLLLQAVESREPEENLCLGCHPSITAQIQKPVEHAAVDLGCASCHTTHTSEPAGAPEGVFHLSEPQPDLCLTCHEADDADLQAAHLGQPFGRSRCTECHNPHGSARAKLLNNFVHPPFADKECDTCHEAPQEERVALLEGARDELCLLCHAEMQERLEQARVTHAAVQGKQGCVACHSPHAATYPHQVRRGPVDLCLNCHKNLAQARVEKTYLHRPAFELSCLICHQEHTGERPRRLRAQVSRLCLECHGREVTPRLGSGGTLSLFGDEIKLVPEALNGMPILAIEAGATHGHPFPAHPVGGGKALNCLTCHNPHAAKNSPKLLVTETPTATPLCVQCHN